MCIYMYMYTYVYYYILGLLEMGYPQVTMGFNTKMVYCNLDDLGLTPFQETAIYIYHPTFDHVSIQTYGFRGSPILRNHQVCVCI